MRTSTRIPAASGLGAGTAKCTSRKCGVRPFPSPSASSSMTTGSEPTDQKLVAEPLLPLLLLVEDFEAALFLHFGDVINSSICGGSRTRRIEEHEKAVVLGGANQATGGLEVLLRLPGIAHDHVGRECEVSSMGPKQGHPFKVFVSGVPSSHVGQNAIGSGLNGKVKIRGKSRQAQRNSGQTSRPRARGAKW